jgi:hypothetical protein
MRLPDIISKELQLHRSSRQHPHFLLQRNRVVTTTHAAANAIVTSPARLNIFLLDVKQRFQRSVRTRTTTHSAFIHPTVLSWKRERLMKPSDSNQGARSGIGKAKNRSRDPIHRPYLHLTTVTLSERAISAVRYSITRSNFTSYLKSQSPSRSLAFL